MSYSLARLLSRPRFASFLTTPLGYSQFKAYLSENASPEYVAQLDLWRDLNILRNLKMQTGYAAKGISRVYRDEIGEWPSSVVKELVHGFQSTVDEATSASLDGPAKHLLDSFYASQFEVSYVSFFSFFRTFTHCPSFCDLIVFHEVSPSPSHSRTTHSIPFTRFRR